MTARVNNYYQLPASQELLQHFREDIGLTGRYLDIFDDLRACSGDTQFHADRVGLSKRDYCDSSTVTHQRCVRELVRLAEIGLKAEQKQLA